MASSRSDRFTYREYFPTLGRKTALWALLFLASFLVIIEIYFRVFPYRPDRTAGSSLHGIRTIFHFVEEDAKPKVLFFGDSSMVGNGVLDSSKSIPGLAKSALAPQVSVYNLAIPAGNVSTELLLVDALERRNVSNVRDIVLQVAPVQYMTNDPREIPDIDHLEATTDELFHFVPNMRPAYFGLGAKSLRRSEIDQANLEYFLTRYSALYRTKDIIRTQEVGNYPSFYVAGKLLALRPSLRQKVLGEKAFGTGRFSAHVEDYPYSKSFAEPSDLRWYFSRKGLAEYIPKAVEAAKKLSRRAPILISHPIHYEYENISPEERVSYLAAESEYHQYLREVARETGAKLIFEDSREWQDPDLWTRTERHFTEAGHARIWRDLAPLLVR